MRLLSKLHAGLNQVVLGGVVSHEPSVRRTPAGQYLAYFGLKHQSIGEEPAQQKRYCYLSVVLQGEKEALGTLSIGQEVVVKGALVRKKTRYGEAELILQAHSFKKI